MTEEVVKRKKKEAPTQKDLLDQELKIGDVVAVARQNDLKVCKVIKISEKMLRAKPINGYSRGGDGWLVYSSATIKLDGPDAMAYVLKNLK